MGYCIKFALSQMKHRKKRTFITMIGIMLSLILCFVIMSIWDSVERYNLEEHYRKFERTQLNTVGGYYEPSEITSERPDLYIGKDKLDELRTHPLVEEVYLTKGWVKAPDMISYEEMDPDEMYDGIFIQLKEEKHLRDKAEELSEDLGIKIIPIYEAVAGMGENSILPIPELALLLVALIFGFCAMLMIRDALKTTMLERIRDYGLCRCVGMEPKQIFGVLLTEAFILIFGSILLSIGACAVLFQLLEAWVNAVLEGYGYTPAFAFVWGKNIVILVLLGVVMAFVSVMDPVRCSLQKTPIDAVNGYVASMPKSRKKIGKYKKAEYAYAVRSIRNAPRKFFALLAGIMVIVFCFSTVISIGESYMREYAKIQNLPKHYEYYMITPGYDYGQLVEELQGKETIGVIEESSNVYEYECTTDRRITIHELNENLLNVFASDMGGTDLYQTMQEEKGVIYNNVSWPTGWQSGDSLFKEGDRVAFLSKEGHKILRETIVAIMDAANEKSGKILDKGYAEYTKLEKLSLRCDETFCQESVLVAREMGYKMENIVEEQCLYYWELDIRYELTASLIEQGYIDYYTVLEVMYDDDVVPGFIMTDQTYQEYYTQMDWDEQGIYVERNYNLESAEKLLGELLDIEQMFFDEFPDVCILNDGVSASEVTMSNIAVNLLKKVVSLLAILFVLMIAVMLYNRVTGEMFQRKEELWTYTVLGMSKTQRIKMVLAENLSAAILGVLFGLELAWLSGFGMIAVTYELEMNMQFIWPWPKIIGGIAVMFAVLVLAVLLAMSGKEKYLQYEA